MSRKIATWTFGCLLLAWPAMAQMGSQPGGAELNTPSPAKDEDKGYEQPERKEPSMWHNPHADTPAAQLALAHQYEQAGRSSRAIKAYNALVHEWHTTPEALLAQEALARLEEETGDFEQAFAEYQYLVAYFSGQFDYLATIEHQYRCANALRTVSHRFLGIKTESLEGVRQMYERILLNGPHWAKAPEVAMTVGALREQEDELEEAVSEYERIANRYAGTDTARDGAYRAAFCRYEIAHRHPRDAQARHFAITSLTSFLRTYPLDPRHDELAVCQAELTQANVTASYEQALFYDRNRNERAAAIMAYRDFLRRFPDAPQAKAAAARLAKLEQDAAALGGQGKVKQP